MSCFVVLQDSRLKLFTYSLSSASQLRYVHAGKASEVATGPNKHNAGPKPAPRRSSTPSPPPAPRE